MLLFYRRRGVVEILKVQLDNGHNRSLLPLPSGYTSIIPAANADIRADNVSFELSSPLSPAKVATLPLDGSAPAVVSAAKCCHSGLLEDDFEVRMVSLLNTRAQQ
jgi:hypothetical protein